MSHYVPLHPLEVDVIYPLLDERDENRHKFERYKVKPLLIELESKIGILELHFKNCELVNGESLKDNGLGAIRTPDLRRVKATS